MSRARITFQLTVALALSAMSTAFADPPQKPRMPIQRMDEVIHIELTGAIAGIKVGQTRQELEARGLRFAPEGIERGENKKGWVSGPLLLIVDAQDRVEVVSIELRRSRGILIEGRRIPREAKLAQIAKLLPHCKSGVGSGGHFLDCPATGGHAIHFYDSFGRDEVTISLF